ncbi:molybdopterin molybdotransferase MoeA [Cohnella xylanilytica]|uniref:Molybdopterin molybdenumtransferase n=1 Tax=Cohnella xylanilytica TaxID=557555 RepID=A0A841TU31_9BACL|nr:molybdopterin molybdotransferase MoeA [Cohnella xylanilytica]MBB6690578.1 molybdopterin molybdotransferase MoeA [Cohnella xylanilytica]
MPTQEIDVSVAVTVEEAVARLVERACEPAEESVRLPDAAGRYLARELYSPFPMPPFRRAAMDGYAVRAGETAAASADRPLRLAVESELRAGASVGRPYSRAGDGNRANRGNRENRESHEAPAAASAVRVFTGSPVPAEYDSIIIQEMVRRPGGSGEDGSGSGGIAWIDRPAVRGLHIAEAGEDVPEGARLLARGTRIGAKEIALLASFGLSLVPVRARPTVAVLPIGDELALPGEPLPPSHIYEANGYMVEASLSLLGADVRRMPPVPDEPEAIRRRLEEAWERADLIVTTGGASVGDYDYVQAAAESAGARPLFTKVRMRPGTPTSAFARGSRTLIALSGNPSACYSGLELLARPFVLAAAGSAGWATEWLPGALSEAVGKPCPYPRYIRSFAWMEEDGWRIRPLAKDKSGNIGAFAQANAIAEIPAGGQGARAGQPVRWFRLA